MFLCYNVFHISYWVSAAFNHAAGSTSGYFLNKNFTFHNKEHNWRIVLKYVINIITCYFVAYGIAKPLMYWLLSGADRSIQENVAMGVGLVIYIGMNYLNLRFYLFKE